MSFKWNLKAGHPEETTLEEAIAMVEGHDLWWHTTKEEVIKHAMQAEEKLTEKLSFGPIKFPYTGVTSIYMDYSEYAITDTFEAGIYTVGVLGKEREGKSLVSKEVRVRGKYAIYKGTPDQWVRDSAVGAREDIIAMAKEMSDIEVGKCQTVPVNFPSGDLVLANYFHESDSNDVDGYDDLPKDIRWDDKYSINHSLGVKNTAEWLSENRGIAYGQLGNTYVSVFQESEDKLVITSAYAYREDDEGYEEEIPVPLHWKFLGKICCDVWRFEAVDKMTLAQNDFDLPAYKDKKEHLTFVDASVNAGEWEMKCYYDYMNDKDMIDKFGYPVYAVLERKQ